MQGMSVKQVVRLAGPTACAIVALAAASGATAAAPPSGVGASDDRYSLRLRALTGPQGADLTLDLSESPQPGDIDTLKKVQLKIYAADGSLEDVRNLTDVPAEDGVATTELGHLERDRLVEADVLVQPHGTGPTYVLRNATRTRLRPDLVVAAVDAPAQTLTTRPIDVRARIAELNGDTAAGATVTLMWGPSPVADPIPVTVPAGGNATGDLHGRRADDRRVRRAHRRRVRVAPAQTDDDERHALGDGRRHRERARPLERGRAEPGRLRRPVQPARLRADHEPARGHPSRPGGEGEGARAAARPDLLQRRLRGTAAEPAPGTSRRSTTPWSSRTRPARHQHHLPGGVNVAKQNPVASMTRFAAVLEDLVGREGYTNVRWVTVAERAEHHAR